MLALVLALSGCGTLVDAGGKTGIKLMGVAGGTVESDLGVKLWLPPGALPGDVTVSLAVVSPAPEGVERAVEVRPLELKLALPGVITFSAPGADRPKVARALAGGGWAALPGRRLDPSALSAPLQAFGVIGVMASNEQCAGGADEDGDGLVDCADPVCAGEAACSLSCQTSADCACGATCIGGGCTAPNPRFCSSASDCAGGVACSAAQSRGRSCGFLSCNVPGTAAGTDGGVVIRSVAACPPEADQCACEACASTSECPLGSTCQPASHKSGRELCGRDVCL